MSVITIRSIFCDGDCGNWRFQRPDPASTLRLLAAREGWKRRDGKDICPTCAPASVQGAADGEATFALMARAIETKAPLDIALALNAYSEDASTPTQADRKS